MDSLARIVILSPLPEGRRLAWIDLNPYLTALSWTTGIGGYLMLNLGQKVRGMPAITAELHNPIEVPDLATIQVWFPSENGFLAFEGRVQDVDDLGGLRVQKLTAAGFGTSQGAPGDDWFSVPVSNKGGKTIDDIERSAANLLFRMVPAVTDILRMGDRTQVVDPGGDYTPRQQAGRYLGQAIDQIQKAGAGGGQDVMYAVYEDRRIQLNIIEPPVDDAGVFLPDYRLSLDARVVWNRSGAKLIGACAVEYTPPGKTKQVTPVRTIPGWSEQYGGLFRSMLVPTSSMTFGQAIQVRDRILRRYSQPIIKGTVTINMNDKKMEGRTGQPVPYYMYRYGEWIQHGERPFFITDTSIDASSQKAEIKFVNVPLSTGEVG